MTIPSLIIGLLMIAVGFTGYLNAEPDAEGKVSPTALIPAYIGIGIALCGVLVMAKPDLRKHVMHLAALLGVFGLLGGFMPIIRQTLIKGQPLDVSRPAVISGMAMSLLSLLFVVLCVRSFIAARKARENVASPPVATGGF